VSGTAVPLPAPLVPGSAVGTHLADESTVASLELTAGGAGVLLGADQQGALRALSLFRPEPTQALAVSGLALAQLLAFRSLAVGAQVVVETARPAAWQSFASLAAGTSGWIALVEQADTGRAGTSVAPQLTVLDHQASAATESRRAGIWGTVLTVHDQVSHWNAELLAAADVVLLQELNVAESRQVGKVLAVPPDQPALSALPPDVVTVATRAGMLSVQVRATSVEQWLIGPVLRRTGAEPGAPAPH
jgi:hypothetical protein